MTTPFLAAGVAAWAAVLMAAPALAGEPPPADAPPHARPGQCFQKVERAPLFEAVREQVVDEPAHAVSHVIPAEYRWEDRQVLVTPGRVDEVAVAEVSHEVRETVVVRPPSVRVDTIPPVYDTILTRVLVRPGRTYWKPSQGPTGEILCLVSEPPLYQDQPQTVMREPARTMQTPIPGENRVIVRRVIDVPAHVERHEVAPVYRPDRVKVLATPERTETQDVPATYRTVERRRLVREGGWEWREIACTAPPPCPVACAPPPPPCATCLPPPRADEDLGPPPPPPPPRRAPIRGHRWVRGDYRSTGPANMTAQIQTALRKRGYYKGPVDGLYTGETERALGAFERANDLPVGPPTPRTARALGVY